MGHKVLDHQVLPIDGTLILPLICPFGVADADFAEVVQPVRGHVQYRACGCICLHTLL